jgi:hypothetical protein
MIETTVFGTEVESLKGWSERDRIDLPHIVLLLLFFFGTFTYIPLLLKEAILITHWT